MCCVMVRWLPVAAAVHHGHRLQHWHRIGAPELGCWWAA